MFTNLIQAEALLNSLEDDNLVILDCRFSLADKEAGREDYQLAHIPNAVYAHLDDDLSGEIIPGQTGRHPLPPIEAFAKKCSHWGIDSSTQVIAYDQGHGGIAARLWFLLKWLGHEQVAVLDGGWQQWSQKEMPTSNLVSSPTRKTFTPKPNPKMIVEVNTLVDNLTSKEWLVVDSRSAERYRGEQEPIDPVAGHIPAAISAPFLNNLDKNGQFLSKEALRERFDNLLKEKEVEETIFYCGSGVTACHNLLALDYIDRQGAKLYPGSWSHWITDRRNRPIAVTKLK